MGSHPYCDRFSASCSLLLAIGAALLSGCAGSPPVQAMSDARQAVRAAQGDMEPASHRRAEQLLEEARDALAAGEYGQARQRADEARRLARGAGRP